MLTLNQWRALGLGDGGLSLFPMIETSASLLERLRERPQADDWTRLVDLYQPWIHDWLRRQGVQEHDAADITQDVLTVMVQELPRFHYDPARGKFRSWVRTITVNRLRAFRDARHKRPATADDSAVAGMVDQLADPHSGLSQLWDREHDAYLVRRALALIKPDFKPETWKAFERVVLDGQPPASVAEELGTTRNAVYLAQSRVLARLRQELLGLCD